MRELYTYKFKDEKKTVENLIDRIEYPAALEKKIAGKARHLVEFVRDNKSHAGTLQKFIQEYDLSTKEGLALMSLAEALLRVPDHTTANALIKDRLTVADWQRHIMSADDILVKLSSLGLATSKSVINSMVNRVGMPVIREATFAAMKILGNLFVLGQSIEEALKRGQKHIDNGYLYSFDMLGEGARTYPDAERYFNSYLHAVEVIGKKYQNPNGDPIKTSGISIKLSALNPEYNFAKRDKCIPDLTDKLMHLSERAAHYGIGLTMDAEEADRLMLSLDIFETVMKEKRLKDWEGLGLAVQAYQKRAYPLIEHLEDKARSSQRRLCVRLVKGAYWDSEIKHTQLQAYPEYPVFTRKSNTDLSYLTCAQKLLNARDIISPMLASHNAHTIAAVLEFAGKDRTRFALQKLHGMGDQLFDKVKEENVPISIYGPVGAHRDLLPYLVRRLLENGANSSFVNQIYDENIRIRDIIADPVRVADMSEEKRHTRIPLPKDIYQPDRPNSLGIDLTDTISVNALYKKMEVSLASFPKPLKSATLKDIDESFKAAKSAYKTWDLKPAKERAEIISRVGDLFEKNMEYLMAICTKEAGKTIPDGIAEVREAVEFAHYYAKRGIEDFGNYKELQGPTGEQNLYRMRGRGVFVCISPWNFPLAIFAGQVLAALMAGNTVICKPAEQTPLIAQEAVRLMHEAGIPKDVLILLLGDGAIGAKLVAHKDVAGVAFTGSTEAAQSINRALAAKDGAITPLIAETGGQNAMIVDSTALAEQVVDDAMLSGFGSAGQRCSALRLLCLQEDTAEGIITMMCEAMESFVVGDPWQLSSNIGPVIDKDAYENLVAHKKRLQKEAKILKECQNVPEDIQGKPYFAPLLAEISSLAFLKREVFGPIIHVLRYKAKERDQLIEDINALGYGLTFGFHSRIIGDADRIVDQVRVGNVYVNRSMIGAVVGVQPFGGQGLSGTGAKAGGPHYLHRFATEQSISINTTAAGGNTTLVSLKEA